MGKKYFLQPRI